MVQHLRPAIVMTLLFTLLVGIIYPFAITGAAQVVFPAQANGSLITKNNVVVGSSLIGQNFADPKYFHPRPSATGDILYNASNSSGSNLGPTSQKLVDRVKGDVVKLRSDGVTAGVPADAVTTSASGLDPHISPANALDQVARVAKARNLPADKVKVLVDQNTEGALLGILGEPRVNVLQLNLALDAAGTN
ncbi:MAG: kdpC [Hyphomicrobiales bacterium]|nr:kdpC [Hyphomicrobiales bacterium]